MDNHLYEEHGTTPEACGRETDPAVDSSALTPVGEGRSERTGLAASGDKARKGRKGERLRNLTQARLKELLHYDPETGLFTRLVKSGKCMPGTAFGTKQYAQRESSYLTGMVDGMQFYVHRLAWFYVHGTWPILYIDHINGRKDDNRIANLREVNAVQNAQNTRADARSASGYRGVSWNAVSRKWHASITFEGKDISLGYFKTPQESSAAYKTAVKLLHTHRPAES